MLFLKVNPDQTTEFPISEEMLRKELSHISLPTNFADMNLAELEALGFHEVPFAPTPTEKVVGKRWGLGTPKLENGKYVRTFELQDAHPKEDEILWKRVRSKRDKLLAETDWTQLADAPIDKATKKLFASYRQALRDVTDVEDPIFVTWPEKPQ